MFHDRVLALCARAGELAGDLEAGTALVVWLQAVGGYVAATRGLSVAILERGRETDRMRGGTCHDMVCAAGDELLARARAAGAVRPEVAIADLVALVNAISLLTEHHPEGAAEFDRLLTRALGGIRPVA